MILFIFMHEALTRGWSHVLYVQVCMMGRKGDHDELSSLGLDDDALLYSRIRAWRKKYRLAIGASIGPRSDVG